MIKNFLTLLLALLSFALFAQKNNEPCRFKSLSNGAAKVEIFHTITGLLSQVDITDNNTKRLTQTIVPEYNKDGTIARVIMRDSMDKITSQFNYTYKNKLPFTVTWMARFENGLIQKYGSAVYDFDTKGNLVKMTKRDSAETPLMHFEYEYDKDGNNVKVKKFDEAGVHQYTNTYEYGTVPNPLLEISKIWFTIGDYPTPAGKYLVSKAVRKDAEGMLLITTNSKYELNKQGYPIKEEDADTIEDKTTTDIVFMEYDCK
ncbi:MAG: hypothetical protein NTX03_04975 [Bacteroidetes bacterium]|nr:hypothetical protein [Bacteroidota bacterium]